MILTTLVRDSEPYSRYGNISADGVSKLLGAPNLDQLQTVIRETVQNSWDAREEGKIPEYRIRLRTLLPQEKNILAENIFPDLPDEPDGEEYRRIQDLLAEGENFSVFEICDFGTCGLGGPTHPDEIPEKGEAPDFVDFLRNIGTPRDTFQGGGTYGYGKSCLYSFSRCHTIIVDTLAKCRNEVVRRLMACKIGHRYDSIGDDGGKRFTGRHWWGVRNGGEVVEPVTSDDAAGLASALGFPDRREEEFGTSIMILAPDIDENSRKEMKARLAEILLWNFWPKMIEYDSCPASMKFSLEIEREECSLPKPEDCSPIDLFSEAMRNLKADSSTNLKIECKSPKKILGKLSTVKNLRSLRNPALQSSENIIPSKSQHVALMRPAELVLKYLEGESMGIDDVEWAGVFIVDSDHQVERAFAEAEPPAHDDWIPDYLPAKSRKKTFVKVALKRIREAMIAFHSPEPKIGGDKNGESIGSVADAVGSMISGLAGSRLGGVTRGRERTGSRGGRQKPFRLEKPKFKCHTVKKGMPCARFDIRLKGPKGKKIIIRVKPEVVIDGGGTISELPGGKKPEVLEWRDSSDREIGNTELLLIETTGEEMLSVLVSIPGYVAVSLKAFLEEVSK